MTTALEGGEWSAACPCCTLSPGKTQYPFYRRLGGPQGRSGWAENLVPTGIQSRTIQPVAQSLYRLSYLVHMISMYLLQIMIGKNQHSTHNTTNLEWTSLFQILTCFNPSWRTVFLSLNLLIGWQLSIWICCKPFFSLLCSCQLLCFWRLALSFVVKVGEEY